MGFYIIEELKYFLKGVFYFRGLEDYKIFIIIEILEEFYVILVYFRNFIVIYLFKVRIFDFLLVGRE